MHLRVAFIVLAAALTGCANTRMVSTQTIHNADASRIWIVYENQGSQHVLLCDVQMFKEARALCAAWPTLPQALPGQ